MPNLKIEIASVPDRDELVAELWDGDTQLAELSQDNGELALQLYRPPSGNWWQLGYEEFLQKLTEMKRRLREE